MKIKILSYNIHKGFNLGNRRSVLREIRDSLRETGADLCFLQEVVGFRDSKNRRTEAPTEAQFEYLADTVWHHHSYGRNAVYPSRHHGNAILSKYPITATRNIDLSTNRFERRGLLHCLIEIDGVDRRFHLFNTHLNLLSNSRERQLVAIMNEMRAHVDPGDFLVLAGDFNDWSGRLTDPLTTELGLVECFHGPYGRHANTFPSFFPIAPLDRIYCKNLRILNQTVLDASHWRRLSDHLPLYVELELE